MNFLLVVKKIEYGHNKLLHNQTTKMIYETIPRKYLFDRDQEFEKFVNSDKYTPEAHFCEFMKMLGSWLNWAPDAILDCKKSETARIMGLNMKILNEVKDSIYQAVVKYFDNDVEKYKEWFHEHNSQQLHDESYNILKPFYSNHLNIYLESCNVKKVLVDKFHMI